MNQSKVYQFPIETWSVYSRNLSNLSRTSNFAEDRHNKFYRLVSTHPDIYKIINDININEQKETET